MTAFLLAVAVIFLAAAAGGTIAARVGLPRVVGEMGAGLVLGQSVLGHVWKRGEEYLFGEEVLGMLEPIALLVVLLYVALVGAELDREVLRGRSRGFGGAVAVGLASAVCGAVILNSAFSDLKPDGIPEWAYLVFVTCAFLVTAVPVLARILDETGLTRTRVGALTLTLSIADDFVAFSMIAIAVAVATDGSLALAAAGTVLVLCLAVVGARPPRRLRSRLTVPQPASPVGIGVFALVIAAVAFLGASILVAAFVVGAALWRPAARNGRIPGGALIRAVVPLYIVVAALAVDVNRLATPRLALAVLLVTALAVVTKGVASVISAPLFRLDRRESTSLVVLRNTRGLTELVALNIGYQAGLLSQDLYTVFFSMALITTAASGAVAMAALRPLGKARIPAPEARPDLPAAASPLASPPVA